MKTIPFICQSLKSFYTVSFWVPHILQLQTSFQLEGEGKTFSLGPTCKYLVGASFAFRAAKSPHGTDSTRYQHVWCESPVPPSPKGAGLDCDLKTLEAIGSH